MIYCGRLFPLSLPFLSLSPLFPSFFCVVPGSWAGRLGPLAAAATRGGLGGGLRGRVPACPVGRWSVRSCLPWRRVAHRPQRGLGEILGQGLACPGGKWSVHSCLPGKTGAGSARESSLRISHRKNSRPLPGTNGSPAWPTWRPGGYVRESSKPKSGCAAASPACLRRSARESSLRISHRKTKEQLPSRTISPARPTYRSGGYVRESREPKSGCADPPLAISLVCSRISARESPLRISHRKTNGQLPSTKISPAWLTFELGGYVRKEVCKDQKKTSCLAGALAGCHRSRRPLAT